MTYIRLLTKSTGLSTPVQVWDTAGNLGTSLQTDIGIDTVPPKVSIVPATNSVTLTVTDTVSGLWRPATLRPLPSTIQNIPSAKSLLYRTATKAAYQTNPTSIAFDAQCGIVPDNADYYGYRGEPTAPSTSQSATLPITGVTNSINTTSNVIAYCVQDNAGNVTRGVYPSDPIGCFSENTLSPVPTFANYRADLQARISAVNSYEQRFGYGLSSDPSRAACFWSILGSNINTLIANHYISAISTANTTLDWSHTAVIQGLTPTRENTEGYYYFSNTGSSSPLLIINNSPSRMRSTVLADGMNVQINADIVSATTNSLLVIIAHKNSQGAGGNIFIDPSVTRIDAVLIADGALMNAQNGIIQDWITDATTKTYLLSTRLTINGRLYSFNTRGGSINLLGSTLVPINGTGLNPGVLISKNVFTAATNTISLSAAQDLEHFRMITDDGDPSCSLTVNYSAIASNDLSPILQKPANIHCDF